MGRRQMRGGCSPRVWVGDRDMQVWEGKEKRWEAARFNAIVFWFVTREGDRETNGETNGW